MRRGKLERSFGIDRANGIAELLAGTIGLEQAIRTTRVPGLSFLRAPEQAAEIAQAADVAAAFGRQYLEGLEARVRRRFSSIHRRCSSRHRCIDHR